MTPDERTAEKIAREVEAALYLVGYTDAAAEEDARGPGSIFRVEIPWEDGHTWHAIITKHLP